MGNKRKAQGVQVAVVTGRFKNVGIGKNGRPVVAVAELDPKGSSLPNAYIRTDANTGKTIITQSPPIKSSDKPEVKAVLREEFYPTRGGGSVSLMEVKGSAGRKYSNRARTLAQQKRGQGKDLGAGVVRRGRRQHIAMR